MRLRQYFNPGANRVEMTQILVESVGVPQINEDDCRCRLFLTTILGVTVFISHSVKSHAPGTAFAHQLFDALQSAHLDPFLDFNCLQVGDNWDPRLEAAARTADAAVVLVTNTAFRSEYVHHEMNWLTGGSHVKPVIPVLFDGISSTELENTEWRPYRLSQLQCIQAEPPGAALEAIVRTLNRITSKRLESYLRGIARLVSYPDPEERPRPYCELRVRKLARPSSPQESGDVTNAAFVPEVSASTLPEAQSHIVLQAGAGAGKSMLLRALAKRIADDWRQGKQRHYLPAYAEARALAGLKGTRALNLFQAVVASGDFEQLDADFFENPPASGACWLLLVDGLDEVPIEARDELLDRIRRWSDDPAARRIIVASRPNPQLDAFGPPWDRYEILPLSAGDLASYAAQRFAKREVASSFADAVNKARLGRLATTPLLLHLAADVFDAAANPRLPVSRAELYASYVASVLSGARWQRFRHAFIADWAADGGSADVAGKALDNIDALLARLAKADAGCDLLAKASLWLGDFRPQTSSAWLEERTKNLLVATGLFDVRRGHAQFIHHSFREFLLARANHASGQTALEALGTLEGWTDPDQALMVLGLSAPEELEKVIESMLRNAVNDTPRGEGVSYQLQTCSLELAARVCAELPVKAATVECVIAELIRAPSSPSILRGLAFSLHSDAAREHLLSVCRRLGEFPLLFSDIFSLADEALLLKLAESSESIESRIAFAVALLGHNVEKATFRLRRELWHACDRQLADCAIALAQHGHEQEARAALRYGFRAAWNEPHVAASLAEALHRLDEAVEPDALRLLSDPLRVPELRVGGSAAWLVRSLPLADNARELMTACHGAVWPEPTRVEMARVLLEKGQIRLAQAGLRLVLSNGDERCKLAVVVLYCMKATDDDLLQILADRDEHRLLRLEAFRVLKSRGKQSPRAPGLTSVELERHQVPDEMTLALDVCGPLSVWAPPIPDIELRSRRTPRWLRFLLWPGRWLRSRRRHKTHERVRDALVCAAEGEPKPLIACLRRDAIMTRIIARDMPKEALAKLVEGGSAALLKLSLNLAPSAVSGEGLLMLLELMTLANATKRLLELALSSEPDWLRARAARCLSTAGAFDLALQVSREASVGLDVRLHAVAGLGASLQPETQQALAALAADASEPVELRRQSVLTLGDTLPPDALTQLVLEDQPLLRRAREDAWSRAQYGRARPDARSLFELPHC